MLNKFAWPYSTILRAGAACLLMAAFLQAAPNAQEPEATDKPAPKNAKPLDPAFVPVVDEPGLPRVLILGDSISIGYTLPLRAALKGKANLHRPAANCGDTARGLKSLDEWLGEGHWEVIHFNFGLHDLKYLDETGKYVEPSKGKQVAPPELYEKNLRELVARLKKTGAKLVWASTTPVPEGTLGRVRGDEVKYNEVAKKVMAENDIPIDDLCTVASKDLTRIQRPKNVHFTAEGYKQLARSAAAGILAALGK